MSGLLTDSNTLFGTRDLYAVLSINKYASNSEVKRAYYALSLTVHPDRVGKDDQQMATKKFQVLGKIYSILSDSEKRAYYDETGSVDDESGLDVTRDWSDYWRVLFPKIKVEDINEFQAKYQYSEEERSDLKKAYIDNVGDMNVIMESIMCSTMEDEARFREAIEEMIESGEVPSFDSFIKEKPAKTATRKRKAEKEAKESLHAREKQRTDANTCSLEAMILARQNSHIGHVEDFFSNLEQKYCASKNKNPRKPVSSSDKKKKSSK